MEKLFDITQPLIAATSRMIQNIIEYLPQLIGGILLLIFGFIVAKLLRALTIRLAGGMDRLLDTVKLNRGSAKSAITSSSIQIV
ncbi:MAG: hypothetical protein VW802_14045 [Rhodospirillaceae bacterium]|jgi:hypothetical protein